MRSPMAWLAGVLILGIVALATWSLTRGQAPSSPTPQSRKPSAADAPSSKPAIAGPNAETEQPSTTTTPPAATDAQESDTPSPLQQQIQLSAQRGANWLFRMNGVDGRFSAGQIPALNTEMEGDHFLHQASAAATLARAARLTGDERFADRATQTILVLVGETSVDPRDKTVRSTSLPSTLLNRTAAAGLLVFAIHELPNPKKDLLDQAEELCNFLHHRQRADGSLCLGDALDDAKAESDDDGTSPYPAMAVLGVLRSQERRPSAWKLDFARKALSYYGSHWTEKRDVTAIPWQTAAFTEAYQLTKERAFAEWVFAAGTWICELQYSRLDQLGPRRANWWGGFKGWKDGKEGVAAPTVESACCALALVDACRAAKQGEDAERLAHFRDSLELGLQFLMRLQYTQANTGHYADWYRPKVLGGFYMSATDGNLRLDASQHAVRAMSQYALVASK
jgi:hypothetical protein